MQVPFVQGQSQEDLIAKIQNELRRSETAIHVRVLGEPGIGKTKLALEATKTDDLSPLVIYCSALQFRISDLMNNLLRADNHFSVVLVIDECDPHSRFEIWDRLADRGARIKLVTIYNDYDPLPVDDILSLEISRLEDDQIHAIFQGYDISTVQVDRYIEISGGSPRMAHHVGRTLESYPGDPSQLLTHEYFYQSFYMISKERIQVAKKSNKENWCFSTSPSSNDSVLSELLCLKPKPSLRRFKQLIHKSRGLDFKKSLIL